MPRYVRVVVQCCLGMVADRCRARNECPSWLLRPAQFAAKKNTSEKVPEAE